MIKKPFQSLVWRDVNGGELDILDQRVLPHVLTYNTCRAPQDVFDAIVSMAVRGAPAISLAAAYGVVLSQNEGIGSDGGKASALEAIAYLLKSRPTAVNLFWGLNRMRKVAESYDFSRKGAVSLRDSLLDEAHAMFAEDIATNLSIARHGLKLIPETAAIIHHCNTGSLATADYGTALGVIRYAHEQGRKLEVYLDETRPRMQGASLSAFELQAYGVPHTVIVDSASGFLMKTRKVDLCVVGCDRVCANGDTANKIGTYNLALAAKAHGVPFYVACPTSTIDRSTASGGSIEIEERSEKEITEILGTKISPEGTKAWNPAFDITPVELITGFITENGLVQAPFAW